ncbi:UbiX family flavin prenyltransferase [Pasteuria penetrans]|uniref:UbiX family flavin prenyltransferase n=1 Tax=Pasteuria penetrans TaxID=86005 RepID=UPI0011ED5455|nr:flavin prenyltransferase UbiX [Pasteuria penetrans]
MVKHHFVLGLTGASGMPYAWRVLEFLLRQAHHTVHIIVTDPGWAVLRWEHDWVVTDRAGVWQNRYGHCPGEVVYHPIRSIGASIASGSFVCAGMAVVPCSMGTLARIAHGLSTNLIDRVADVMLKEKRRLVIVPRETPLHSIHLENLLKLSQLGVVVVPAIPAFYQKPRNIDDMVNFVAGKVLESMGLEHDLYPQWKGT